LLPEALRPLKTSDFEEKTLRRFPTDTVSAFGIATGVNIAMSSRKLWGLNIRIALKIDAFFGHNSE
jgi:hypothetical protein